MRTLGCLSALLLAVSPASAQDAPAPLDPASLVAELAAERAGLEIDNEVWTAVATALGRTKGSLGYTSDEMRSYGGDTHLLRTVDNLFRDVRTIPRETGRVTDDLIARGARGEIDGLLQRCWGLLDAPAGRRFPPVPRDAWGVTWIHGDASPTEVLAAIHTTAVEDSRLVPQGFEPPPFNDAVLEGLPAPVQRLVARLALGAFESQRWSGETPDFVFRVAVLRDIVDGLQRTARASTPGPWRDEEYGQSATREHDMFDRLAEFDTARNAYASVILAAHLRTALEEIRGADYPDIAESRTVALPWGPVVVGGKGDDGWRHENLPDQTWCVIDLGGNDAWLGAFAAPLRGTDSTVALAIDLGGDDMWDARDEEFALGCGAWGIGVLVDVGGNDVYENGKYASGAAAHYAIGVHVDVAGDDSYNQGVRTTKNQFQGHARDGSIGVFVDGAGDDRYLLRNHCAGGADLASIALFWDRAGDDVYEAQLDEVTDWARPPFGSASRYASFRSFRDDLIAWGVFLDTGGDDTYPEGDRARNGATWTEHERPNAHAVGIDR